MATFFVGQRVRITHIYSAENLHLLGSEGRIVESEEVDFEGARETIYGLDISSIERKADEDAEDECWVTGFGAEQLAPIQPSSHRAGDYSLSELLDRCRAGEGVPA
jgi:hypothetical protein